MAKLIDALTIVAAVFMIAYSLWARDWPTAAITGTVMLGFVAYRRGWIRRFGR